MRVRTSEKFKMRRFLRPPPPSLPTSRRELIGNSSQPRQRQRCRSSAVGGPRCCGERRVEREKWRGVYFNRLFPRRCSLHQGGGGQERLSGLLGDRRETQNRTAHTHIHTHTFSVRAPCLYFILIEYWYTPFLSIITSSSSSSSVVARRVRHPLLPSLPPRVP